MANTRRSGAGRPASKKESAQEPPQVDKTTEEPQVTKAQEVKGAQEVQKVKDAGDVAKVNNSDNTQDVATVKEAESARDVSTVKDTIQVKDVREDTGGQEVKVVSEVNITPHAAEAGEVQIGATGEEWLENASPEEIEALKATLEGLQEAILPVKDLAGITAAVKNLISEPIREVQEVIQQALAPARETLQAVANWVNNIKEEQEAFFASEKWPRLQEAFPDLTREQAEALLFNGLTDPTLELLPEFLEEMQAEGQAQGKQLTAADLMQPIEYTPEEQAAQNEAEAAAEAAGEEPPHVPLFVWETMLERAAERHGKKLVIPARELPANMKMPLDKINSNVWGNFTEDNGGQLQILFNVTSGRDKKKRAAVSPVNIYTSINFDALDAAVDLSGKPIAKRMTYWDKFVYECIGTLYDEYGEYVLVSEVLGLMGNRSRPGKPQINKVVNSIIKQSAIWITIDSTEEAKRYKGFVPMNYKGQLLYAEIVEGEKNGGKSDAVIHILQRPVLMAFAEDRNQITAVPKAALVSTVSNTEGNLAIKDYLLQEIAHMKNNLKWNRKMLYSTIYEKCGKTTRKQKYDTRDIVPRYLEDFKKSGFIDDYKISGQESVTIIIH